MSQHRGLLLGAVVGGLDELHVKDGSCLHLGHRLNQATHEDFVGEVDFVSREDTQGVGDVGNVEVCGVFHRGSPSTDDGLDGSAVIVTDVATEKDKGGS